MAKKCDISGTGVQSGNNVSHANNKTRQDIMTICEILGAKVDDISPTSMTMELSDTPDRLDSFQEMMRTFNILEVVRTGVIALQKGGGKI